MTKKWFYVLRFIGFVIQFAGYLILGCVLLLSKWNRITQYPVIFNFRVGTGRVLEKKFGTGRVPGSRRTLFPRNCSLRIQRRFSKKAQHVTGVKKVKIIVHGENLGSKKDDSESTKLQKRFLLSPKRLVPKCTFYCTNALWQLYGTGSSHKINLDVDGQKTYERRNMLVINYCTLNRPFPRRR